MDGDVDDAARYVLPLACVCVCVCVCITHIHTHTHTCLCVCVCACVVEVARQCSGRVNVDGDVDDEARYGFCVYACADAYRAHLRFMTSYDWTRIIRSRWGLRGSVLGGSVSTAIWTMRPGAGVPRS